MSGKLLLVAVDCGRRFTKVYTGMNPFEFPSRYAGGRKLHRERKLGENEFILEYQGRTYFMADLADEGYAGESNFQESKIHDQTLLLALTALSVAGVPSGYPICIATGLPVRNYDDTKEREGLMELLRGTHRLTFNGEHRTFHIERVLVAMESASAALSVKIPKVGETVVLDPGSRTINATRFVNGKFRDKGTFTIPHGWDTVDVPESEKPYELARIIESEAGKSWSQSATVFVIGGNPIELALILKRRYHNTQVVNNSKYSNVLGYWEVGRQVLGDTMVSLANIQCR